ncbi:restriction endonuclease subunit S [Vibrio parahaemolyticus]
MESLALMPSYEAYKDSGVEWLGDIPASWSLLANKHIFRLKKKQVGKRSNEYDLLSLTLRGVIKRDMENPEGKFPAEFDSYQEVRCGDFIFCLFDVEETPRTVGLSPFNGMITGAYTVFEPNDNFDNRFLYYFYLNLDAKKRLKPLYRGLRNTIPKDSFLSFKTFVPPHEQQTRIANFLDQKTAQIDDAIGIKEQQISLLKERKQIIIQQAVTQGLDPNVPMKDSGVDWIGKIPAHWEMKRVKNIFRLVMQPSEKNNDYELLSVYTDIGVKPRRELEERGNKASTTDGYWFVKKGDIVVNKLLAWMGAIGLSEYEGVTSPAYDILRPKLPINGFFYHYLFRSDFCSAELKRHSRGIMDMRLRLYFDRFGVVEVPYPPVDEQNEIIHSLETEMKEMDKGIEHLNTQIEKLKEYKTTLINSAVTGKIKITPEMVEQ